MFREAQTEQENAGNLVRRENNIDRTNLEVMGAKPQLIMFMTGAGGAGKSAVINAFMTYCKEFYSNLDAHFDK
eukprot:scaffold145692_cov63-Attheya_sp.AAC.2